MTRFSQFFSSYSLCVRNQKVKITNSSFATVSRKEKFIISHIFSLKNVLHIPYLSYNLLSVSKLTHNHNCQINFWFFQCKFQDLSSKRRLGMLSMTVAFTSLIMVRTLEGKTIDLFQFYFYFQRQWNYIMGFLINTFKFPIYKAFITQIIHE